MNRIFTILIMAVMAIPGMLAEKLTWWGSESLQDLEVRPDRITITLDRKDGITLDKEFFIGSDDFYMVYDLAIDSDEYRYLKDNNIRRIEGPVVYDADGPEYLVYVGPYFDVHLKKLEDISLLEDWMERYNLWIRYRPGTMPDWVLVSVTAETGYNSFEMSQIMYESGDFAYAGPDFIELNVFDDGSGVESVTTTEETKAYYDLQGRRVENPDGGIYIERCGEKTRKVVIRK